VNQKDKEAMQKALDALETVNNVGVSVIWHRHFDNEIKALREQLSQDESESVDWEGVAADQAMTIAMLKLELDDREKQVPIGEIVRAFSDLVSVSIPKMPPVGTKLYTAPPKREWVSLTNEEIVALIALDGVSLADLVNHIDLKLQEKNT
jgi:hypothetical protein